MSRKTVLVYSCMLRCNLSKPRVEQELTFYMIALPAPFSASSASALRHCHAALTGSRRRIGTAATATSRWPTAWATILCSPWRPRKRTPSRPSTPRACPLRPRLNIKPRPSILSNHRSQPHRPCLPTTNRLYPLLSDTLRRRLPEMFRRTRDTARCPPTQRTSSPSQARHRPGRGGNIVLMRMMG